MTSSEVVEVVVYDAPVTHQDCTCGCGGHRLEAGAPRTGVNMEMETRALALTLESDFPQQMKVEYINVLQDPRGPHLPQTVLLRSEVFPTPLVFINGRARFAGALPVERIREKIGKILAVSAD